jgi:hypothetical protein
MRLSHLLQTIQTRPREESEITGVCRQFSVDKGAHESVEEPCRKSLDPGLSETYLTLTKHDIIPLAITFNHSVNDLQRVLQVTIDGHYGITG